MADELIRLDTTIIGIDSLINKASTAEEAKVLFAAKDVIYSQQRYSTDEKPVKRGRWICNEELYYNGMTKCSYCNEEYYTEDIQNLQGDLRTVNYCPNCGARMDGDAE